MVLADDVRRTISDLSLEGSCPERVHDISVFLGRGLSPQLEAFMCSGPLPVLWESPLGPRCFRHPEELKPSCKQ